MKNESFGRKVKNAYKNARREYEKYRREQFDLYLKDEISIYTYWACLFPKEYELCLKYSYPLGLYATTFSCLANLVRCVPNRTWRIIGRLSRAARKKGMIVYPSNITWFILYSGETDWRKLPFKNYNLMKALKYEKCSE
jgi:hypothetical protein